MVVVVVSCVDERERSCIHSFIHSFCCVRYVRCVIAPSTVFTEVYDDTDVVQTFR